MRKIDSTTPIGELIAAVSAEAILDEDAAIQRAAHDELARRSRDAERYARLTRALCALIEVSGWYGVSISSAGIFWQPSGEAIADHDGTPDGIANAIIKAMELSGW